MAATAQQSPDRSTRHQQGRLDACCARVGSSGDLRRQGLLCRHLATQNADLLQVSADPTQWSEDDTLHALSLLGSDQSGDLILGEVAMRRWLDSAQHGPEPALDSTLLPSYLRLAEQAMATGSTGSLAGG